MMDRAPSADNMANTFLVEISNFNLWPFNPVHISSLSEAHRDLKQESLVAELRQVRIMRYFQLMKKKFSGG